MSQTKAQARVDSVMATMPKPTPDEKAAYEKLADELHTQLLKMTTEPLNSWKSLLKKNGATLHRKKFPPNPVECFRLETRFDRSPEVVMDLIWDMTAQNEGVEIFDHAEILQKVTDNIQIEVSYTKPVLVVSGRENITIRSYRVESDGSHTMAGRTVDPPKNHISPPDFIRSNVYLTGYRLFPLDDGKACHCVNILWTDPCGHIPKMLVNTQGRQIALQRFLNIRRLAHLRPEQLPPKPQAQAQEASADVKGKTQSPIDAGPTPAEAASPPIDGGAE